MYKTIQRSRTMSMLVVLGVMILVVCGMVWAGLDVKTAESAIQAFMVFGGIGAGGQKVVDTMAAKKGTSPQAG